MVFYADGRGLSCRRPWFFLLSDECKTPRTDQGFGKLKFAQGVLFMPLFSSKRKEVWREWCYFFKSFSNVSTAAFSCVSSPLTTVSGLLATFTSGSNSEFSR